MSKSTQLCLEVMDANTTAAYGEAIGHVVVDIGRIIHQEILQNHARIEGGRYSISQTRTLQLLKADQQHSGAELNICWSYIADVNPGAALGDEV